MSDFESIFDEFIATQPNGHRIDSYKSGKFAKGLNADYYMAEQGLVLELKTLEKNQASPENIRRRLQNSLKDCGYKVNLADQILSGAILPPTRVSRKMEEKTGNALNGLLRKANKQVSETRNRIGEDAKFGALIVANVADLGFNPHRMARFLSGKALSINNCALDVIIITTPEVDYDEGDGKLTQYWYSVYADGKQSLGDFIEPFGFSWLEFLAEKRGEEPNIIPTFAIFDEMTNAKPIGYSYPKLRSKRPNI